MRPIAVVKSVNSGELDVGSGLEQHSSCDGALISPGNRWLDRVTKLSVSGHQDRMARATTAKQTPRAPAANKTREISFAVAPVVITSSINRMRFPVSPDDLPQA